MVRESDPLRKLIFNDHFSPLYGVPIGYLRVLINYYEVEKNGAKQARTTR